MLAALNIHTELESDHEKFQVICTEGVELRQRLHAESEKALWEGVIVIYQGWEKYNFTILYRLYRDLDFTLLFVRRSINKIYIICLRMRCILLVNFCIHGTDLSKCKL
jgi:hypothetical protein